MIPRSPGIFLEKSLHKGLFFSVYYIQKGLFFSVYYIQKILKKNAARNVLLAANRKILFYVTAVAMQLVLVGFFECFEAALHFSTLLQLVGIA